MVLTLTPMSTLPGLCAPVSTPKLAHSTAVGFLAVRRPDADGTNYGAEIIKIAASRMTGGLLQSEPRKTKLRVNVLPIMGANGTSVSAFQGSQKPVATAPAGAKASGVPPRSRPV